MYNLNKYSGMKVFITGHTGFKGAWLSLWLKLLGAEVTGYSLEAPTEPNLFSICNLENKLDHNYGDICDYESLYDKIKNSGAEIVFHLAAQSLVIDSYSSPQKTFFTNSQGTINLLEAGVNANSVKAIIAITTDKVYENLGGCWGYRENDRLGAHDPYSTSKAMAELAIECYKKSFSFKNEKYTAIASARSGNVIGGGDFSTNRLLPDLVKALNNNQPLYLRNPLNTRPWMNVLDTLHGYVVLGIKLLENPHQYNEAWNFAPKESMGITCEEIVKESIAYWNSGDWYSDEKRKIFKEMDELRLNGEKTLRYLNWAPHYSWKESLHQTLDWYKNYKEFSDMYDYSLSQIKRYCDERNEILECNLLKN